MPTITLTSFVSIGGVTIQGAVQRTAETPIGTEFEIPAAKTGTLSTRTSDTAGTLTMAGGHGLAENDRVDIYWADGVAYGATVGEVAGNSVPFTGAAGDVLPAQSTAITAGVRKVIDLDFTADKAVMIVMSSTRRGHADVRDSGGTELAQELIPNEPWTWVADQGVANPLAGDIVDAIHVSNGDSANAATFRMGVLYDSVA